MSNNKKPGFAGKGYYIALILCAAAIGITGYWYYRSESNAEEVSLQETVGEDVLVGTVGTEDVPVIATQPTAGSTAKPTTPSSTQPAPAPTAPAPKKELKTMSPIGGAEIFGYSMEALSYNQTTRDWRVHNGVDLAAEDGAEVCAAADGTVYTAYEDEAYGWTVILRHVDGYTTRYCSLQEDLAVQPGDQVTMGQVIGYAGSTALVEAALGSHVHFSVSCNDEPMDPAEFLAIGGK